MKKLVARKTTTVILRETRGFHFNKIRVWFDKPAGRPGEESRNLTPIYPHCGSDSFGDIAGVRAFNGLWEIEARVVAPRDANGRLLRGSDGKVPRARFSYHAKHVAWLDEGKLTTTGKMRHALSKLAHARRYAALAKEKAATV